jgi:hypothetical protein
MVIQVDGGKSSKHKKDWAQIIDDFKKSGLAQKAFCKDRSIAIATFRYHFYAGKKLKSDEPYQSSGFQPVQVISKSHASPMFFVRLPNGFVCEIASGFCSHETRVLMELLCQC